MRRLDIAMTTLALRTSETKPPEHEQLLLPALDGPGAALLGRSTISHQHAALIASLWPEPARQCVARPRYEALPAPAVFGRLHLISWPAAASADARALQMRLASVFPNSREGADAAQADAA